MAGAPCVNVKRVYRVKRDHQLLLRRPVNDATPGNFSHAR